MQGSEPSDYEDTGESGEAYDVEKISERLQRQEKRRDEKEALPDSQSVADRVSSGD